MADLDYLERLKKRVARRLPKYQEFNLLEALRLCIERELHQFARDSQLSHRIAVSDNKIVITVIFEGEQVHGESRTFTNPSTLSEAIAEALKIADGFIVEMIT